MKIFRLTLFLVGVLHLGAVDGFTQMTADEVLSKFVGANMAYKEGEYDTAIERYGEILEGGRESGSVYYNLGNSYFRKGDTGRAILNYERAKRLIPRDSDLNFNYRYVESRMNHHAVEGETSFLNRTIKNFIEFYTIEEMILIIIGIVFTAGVIFLLSLYMNWPKGWSRGGEALLIFVLIMYAGGLAVRAQYDRDLAVVVKATESYFEPRIDSTVHFKLPEGTKARILKREGNWIKVERLDGKIGWISAEVLEKI